VTSLFTAKSIQNQNSYATTCNDKLTHNPRFQLERAVQNRNKTTFAFATVKFHPQLRTSVS